MPQGNLLDAGTAFKVRHEEFEIFDTEMLRMEPWEIQALQNLLKTDVAPFKIELWRTHEGDPYAYHILSITYPVPCITTLGASDDPTSRSGEKVEDVPRRVRREDGLTAYQEAASPPASEEGFLGWL